MQIEYNQVLDISNIIDIRISLEFNKFNIPGSRNVQRFNLLKNPELYLNKEEIYYLICNKGEVSLSCAKILNALGYNCYSIIGGVDGLRK